MHEGSFKATSGCENNKRRLLRKRRGTWVRLALVWLFFGNGMGLGVAGGHAKQFNRGLLKRGFRLFK